MKKRTAKGVPMIKLMNQTIKTSTHNRCTDIDLVNFIINLELNAPPENTLTTNSGSLQELEQYLASQFPNYTFGLKQTIPCAQPTIVSSNEEYIITEESIYFPKVTSMGLKQPNLFLLIISESKSLVDTIKGKQSYLVLKCVESAGKVKLVEVKENYL